jgi:putative oxidoreductase
MTNRFFILIGQFIISIMFILVAFSTMMNYQSSLSELESVVSSFFGRQDFSSGVSVSTGYASQVILIFNIALQFFGGIFVFFNLAPKLGSLLLMIYVGYSTVLYHPFWMVDSQEIGVQLVLFLKNLTIFGGLWILLCLKKRVVRRKRRKGSRSSSSE